MAKFVIAGKADCPHYAKAELLGDYLQRNLPDFSVHKWPIDAHQWDQWVTSICEQNQWKTSKRSSPFIWRELIDRGGRGSFVGGLDDFQEYAQCYYGTVLDHFMSSSSALFRAIANENAQQYKDDLALNHEYIKQTIHPYHVGILGAEHPCAYALFPDLLSASLFPNRNIHVRLITDDRASLTSLQAVAMEIEDLACEQFHQVKTVLGSDPHAYDNLDLLIVLDDFFAAEKRKHFDALIAEKTRLKKSHDDANLFDDERPAFEPERLKLNLKPAFDHYCTLARRVHSSSCRILLACSSSTMVATRAFIQTLPHHQILGLARTLENQVKARIAKKLNTDIKNVINLHIIGDIAGEYIIDTSDCQMSDYDGAIWARSHLRESAEMLADPKWLKEVIGKEVEHRDFLLYTHHDKLIRTQASAIISFIRDWINGSTGNQSCSCIMSCSSASLGLPSTSHADGDAIVCAVPIAMDGPDEVKALELNLSNDNRTKLARLIKDMQIKYKMN